MKRSFNCPVLNFKLDIYYTSQKNMANILDIENGFERAYSCVGSRTDCSYSLWISPDLTLEEFERNWFMHELNHIFNFVFERSDIKPDLSNDELESYYKQYVYSKILNILEEMKNEYKRNVKKKT